MKISIFLGKQSKNGPGVKALQFASLTVLVTLDYLQPFVCLSVSLLTPSHNIFFIPNLWKHRFHSVQS